MMELIIGGGFLGSYLVEALRAENAGNIIYTRRDPALRNLSASPRCACCDVTDPVSVAALSALCGKEKLTVFYLASMHQVDRLYENPGEGRRVNLDGLERFLTVFADRTEKLFYASTDCVYGEMPAGKDRFRETDPLDPINEYGRQKAAAERIVNRFGFTALRYPFMLGPSLCEKKHFYDKIRESLLNGEKIEMIDGMFRSVLSYRDAAALTVALSRTDGPLPPVINVCGDRGYGKYDVGVTIAKNLGADPSLVVPLTGAQGAKFFKDRRADNAVMDNALLKRITGLSEILWEEDQCS